MPELSSRPLLSTKLDAPLFVDRAREQRALQRSVESDLNVLVLGTHGSGKTSLLHRLASTLDESRFEPVFVDGARTASGPLQFLSLIVYGLEADRSQPDQLGELMRSIGRRQPATESERLVAGLREVEEALNRRQRRPVLLIDEPPSAEHAYTLFGQLRDELWRLPATWVVAGDKSEAATYLRPPASAFFETIVYIEPLADSDAIELLARRTRDVKVPKAVVNELIAEAGGNPRQLVTLARDAIVSGRRPDQLAKQRSAREMKLAALGDAPRRLVAELEAHGRASASDEQLLARLGWTRSRATQVFRLLEEAGLVRGSLERSGQARPRKVYELIDAPTKNGRP